jgi:hypothetical protein
MGRTSRDEQQAHCEMEHAIEQAIKEFEARTRCKCVGVELVYKLGFLQVFTKVDRPKGRAPRPGGISGAIRG